MNTLPSIFNDVIGPVMRGPSSSHTAASWRIARTALDILNEPLEKALIEFDKEGAWAPNYREQGTTLGIEGGLTGLEISDERILDLSSHLSKLGITIEYLVSSFPTNHANTVRITLWGRSNKKVQIVAVSLGGGAFEIRTVNGYDLQFRGDQYGIILFAGRESVELNGLKKKIAVDFEFKMQHLESESLGIITSTEPFTKDFIRVLQSYPDIEDVVLLHPVMPVIIGKQTKLPFDSLPSLVAYAEKTQMSLAEIGLMYEKCISGLPEEELLKKMESLVQIIQNGIDTGLKGTVYEDRILPQQSHLIEKAEKEGKIKSTLINRIIANVTALMESKSGMEVIVAIPTAGSCGTVGGVIHAMAESIGSNDNEIVKSYFAAGIVGAYFAQGPGFSAEEHGCQVECGAASGMAAASLVQLLGGDAIQAIGAASMAIQNMIGLVCDPVADRVEVPCLGKNISAALNAYSSAIMAVSGFKNVIPLDQVIQTVSQVSKTMPTCVKCTGRGGLAITEESLNLKRKLAGLK